MNREIIGYGDKIYFSHKDDIKEVYSSELITTYDDFNQFLINCFLYRNDITTIDLTEVKTRLEMLYKKFVKEYEDIECYRCINLRSKIDFIQSFQTIDEKFQGVQPTLMFYKLKEIFDSLSLDSPGDLETTYYNKESGLYYIEDEFSELINEILNIVINTIKQYGTSSNCDIFYFIM